MLEDFFNVNSKKDGVEFYLNRSILTASLVIAAMQKLGKEVNGKVILEVFNSQELMSDIQTTFTNNFPESKEARMFNDFNNQESGGPFDSCFEIIRPLISRLELKTNV